MYKDKKVLVTGGTGLIGMPLVQLLVLAGAKVRVASLDNERAAYLPEGVDFFRANLTRWQECIDAVRGMDCVFHLAGIKGSVGIGVSKAASFMVPALLMNTHMMEAAREMGVERYLFTSSIAVYPPTETCHEADAWSGEPHPTDRFAAYAKRVGELQAEAYLKEFNWTKVAVVRPANVYGPWDNFDPQSAMAVASLIQRAINGENPLVIWGNGSNVRDFIYSEDVARGMMLAMEHPHHTPINLTSGNPATIADLVQAIIACVPDPPRFIWDTAKEAGARVRLLDASRARTLLGFQARVGLLEGIGRTVDWYLKHHEMADERYNIFRRDHARVSFIRD